MTRPGLSRVESCTDLTEALVLLGNLVFFGDGFVGKGLGGDKTARKHLLLIS